ncbi:hypothetical protein [Actinophytocola sp.]|uniref:hypothetical protein n=1 Tax=Actinophytocola sp. TaxID=1872138 RepID=UPI002ED504CB
MTTTVARPTRRLTPPTRKWLLLLHVITSLGWLGLNVGNLTLTVTGLTTDDPTTQHIALGATYLVGGPLLVPVSLLAYTSGILLGFYSRWGVFRYRWVLVKFVLTTIAVLLIPLSLLPGLEDVSALVSAAPANQLVDIGQHGASMLSAGIVSTTMYVTCAVLSVHKPWGRTRRAG